MVRDADLILVMETHHLQYILRLDATARGKTFLLGHWAGMISVRDPYMREEKVYRDTYAQIDSAVSAWGDRLR